jgi:hypothetical protein
MRKFLRNILLLPGLLLLVSGSLQSAHASRCGLQGSDNALPGTDLTGYWQGTLGLMRLVRTAPGMVEGPASGSEYLHGAFSNNVWQGKAAIDVGRKYLGTFTIQMTEGGRCLKGSIKWGDDTDEVLGQRVLKPSSAYTTYYVIDQNTEQLKKMAGGSLDLHQIDGADNQPSPSTNLPSPPPVAPTAPSAQSEPDGDQDVEENGE